MLPEVSLYRVRPKSEKTFFSISRLYGGSYGKRPRFGAADAKRCNKALGVCGSVNLSVCLHESQIEDLSVRRHDSPSDYDRAETRSYTFLSF